MTTFPTFAHALSLFLSLVLVFIQSPAFARHVDLPPQTYGGDQGYAGPTKRNLAAEQRREVGRPLQMAAGSRLPDCSHACGSCTPCRLVAVGFACSSLAQAEPCPISYRCVCNGKSYPVP